MKIAISGAGGYIATNLIPVLESANHTVIRINRTDLSDIERLMSVLSDTAVVINLAGAPILQRWSDRNKNVIKTSRIESTKNIVSAINRLIPEHRPSLFISASAIGIYSPDQLHDESSTAFASGFVSEVVKNWEQASDKLNPLTRKVIFRIGLILGKNAKTIQRLIPLFKLGLGGKMGSGKQPFPFIHIDDTVRAILWSIENVNLKGIYNLTAPKNINNAKFVQTFAQKLHRPAIFTVPSFMLKLILGEASSLLLQNPQVYPKRLIEEGFEFTFPDIDTCLEKILH